MSSTTDETERNPVQEFVALEKRRRKLEAELGRIKTDLATTEPMALEWMSSNGIDSCVVEDMTAYVKRELWAKRPDDVSAEELCEGLTAAGLEEFVHPATNMQTLSGYVRELDKDKDDPMEELQLPPELDGLLEVSERFRLRTRKKT